VANDILIAVPTDGSTSAVSGTVTVQPGACSGRRCGRGLCGPSPRGSGAAAADPLVNERLFRCRLGTLATSLQRLLSAGPWLVSRSSSVTVMPARGQHRCGRPSRGRDWCCSCGRPALDVRVTHQGAPLRRTDALERLAERRQGRPVPAGRRCCDEGDTWEDIARHLPTILAVELFEAMRAG